MSSIVSKLASVANKRLKLMESKGIKFAKGVRGYEGPDSISGVKKFGAKGKNAGQLISEYKRVAGFLESPNSTITGRVKTYFETKKFVAKKKGEKGPTMSESRREYYEMLNKNDDPIETLSQLFEAMREGQWLSKGPKWPRNFDSKQVKEYFEEQIAENENLSTEELIRKIKKDLGIDEDIEEQDNNDSVGTSKFF